jgi:hypothetical protein
MGEKKNKGENTHILPFNCQCFPKLLIVSMSLLKLTKHLNIPSKTNKNDIINWKNKKIKNFVLKKKLKKK